MITANKRLIYILLGIPLLLLIPLIAMQFTSEVNWKGFDFVAAAVILLVVGLSMEFVLRTVKQPRHRILVAIGFLVLLLLIWAELAVGIFGTPFAGS